jgi:hypothetical protein
MSDTRLKADQKLAARYSSANGPALQLSGDFDMKLAAWADGKYNNRPQGSGIRNLNTLAIGVFKACGLEPSIAYASQNGKTWSAPDDFPKEFAEYAKRSYNAADAGKHRGFHAEMMIIRYLLKEGYISWKSGDKDKATGSIAESAAKIGLRIVCIEKLCCYNCSGWLKAHGIPHYPIKCSSESEDWIHPRTGALFHATSENIWYHKSGMSDVDTVKGEFDTSRFKGSMAPLKL